MPPSRNDTLPLIVPAVVEVTVAVNVMLVPATALVEDADSAVEVAAFPAAAFTTCETADDVDVAKVAESPRYCTVITCVPCVNVVV